MKKGILLFSLILICIFQLHWQIDLLFAQTNDDRMAVANSNSATALTDDIIKPRIEMYLLKNYHENHNEVVIDCDPLPVPIPVDKADWEIKVDSKYGEVKNGANLVEVTIFSRKEIYKKFAVTARIETYDEIVVAARMLERAQPISEDMLAIERLNTTNFKRDYFTMRDDVTGLQTKQVIGAGKPIFTNMVELPDVIRRGDLIRIIVKLKNMEITATGKALQNGKRGEMIKVQNESTGKRLSAEVLDEKTVLVEL